MSNRRPHRLARRSLVLAGLMLGLQSAAAAPTQAMASASELKAAFVLNFVRFTEWPATALAANGPIVVCLVEDTGVAASFQQIAKGRTANNHEIQARWTKQDDDLRGCHVAYISGVSAKRSGDLVATLQDVSILTLSDDERFAERGGIANFFVESDNMGIAVNLIALQRAKLQISSKLLSLARIVKK